jgi:hypothetical protein
MGTSKCNSSNFRCPSGFFSNSSNSSSSSGSCTQCSTLYCSSGEYKIECTACADTKCMKCSNCPVGSYLSGCKSNQAGLCLECSTKYELQQCYDLNVDKIDSISFYTSAGDLDQDNCEWKCMPSYYKFASMCRPCSTDTCIVGSYRTNCTFSADGVCVPCTKLPENAHFITSGVPFNSDNCQWSCDTAFYLANQTCLPCQRPFQCGIGEVLAPCTQDSNYVCTPCKNKPAFARYLTSYGCTFECDLGYFQNGSLCSKCSSDVFCGIGQRHVNCTADHDSLCSNCLEGLQYASASSIRGFDCHNCSFTVCDQIGTYAEPCSAVEDSKCVPCTLGPTNSHYDSPGSYANNNCSWQCNDGYQKSSSACLACLPGKYSKQGNCASCPAGTYSAHLAASSSLVCNLCVAGKFSSQVGATSQIFCQNCEVGYYQDQYGQTTCEPCPKNEYGIASGASSRSECQQCPSENTTTRDANGQAFQTACVCNVDYYRINNTTIQCNKCPIGLQCTGYSNVFPVINGSIWERIQYASKDYYRLQYCPENYQYADLNTNITPGNIDNILLNQECTPCGAGQECLHPPCEYCSECKPGFYKSCSGPAPCTPCPTNTFQPERGSFACLQCAIRTTTHGKIGCVGANDCTCDSNNYNLGDGCMECPAGLKCFGNNTTVPVVLEYGESVWATEIEPETNFTKLNLKFCPAGYFIQGTILTPGQLQCIPCTAGFECLQPPCHGACTKCKPGFYKASTISSPVEGIYFDNFSVSNVINWIKEPCFPCPVDTYRSREGGTEVGSCTTCPIRSNTRGKNGSTSVSECVCDSFYYRQGVSAQSELTCTDCPQGAVCNSDRSCALGLLSSDSMVENNIQTDLKCINPVDTVVGTWKRGASGEYNLIACPSGFTMRVLNFTASFSSCILCPAGSYLLEEVTSTSIACKPCPIGAICPGGNVVYSKTGYWKADANRRDGTTRAIVYQCPPGFCDENNTCNNARTGPVDSICICWFVYSCSHHGLCHS